MKNKNINDNALKNIDMGPSSAPKYYDWSSSYNFGTYFYSKDGKFIRKAYWIEVLWIKIKRELILSMTREGKIPLWVGVLLDVLYLTIGGILGCYIAKLFLK